MGRHSAAVSNHVIGQLDGRMMMRVEVWKKKVQRQIAAQISRSHETVVSVLGERHATHTSVTDGGIKGQIRHRSRSR